MTALEPVKVSSSKLSRWGRGTFKVVSEKKNPFIAAYLFNVALAGLGFITHGAPHEITTAAVVGAPTVFFAVSSIVAAVRLNRPIPEHPSGSTDLSEQADYDAQLRYYEFLADGGDKYEYRLRDAYEKDWDRWYSFYEEEENEEYGYDDEDDDLDFSDEEEDDFYWDSHCECGLNHEVDDL